MEQDKQEKKKRPKDPVLMPQQDPRQRVKNFEEVPIGYSEEMAKMEASRCIQCKKPQCVSGCPVQVQIPQFIALINEGRYAAAARKIKETNALPAVCGRVCPQEEQCEKACILAKKGNPIKIGYLERFAADYERTTKSVELPKKAETTGKRVAIVGAGPGGLTVAGDLIKLGHEVTIYEAFHKAGGVLVYGIPEFRLPKDIVQAEVEYLEKLGVKTEYNSVIGKLYTIKELMEEERYDSVFIGVGAGLPRFMGIPGEELIGVYSANEYLTRVNLMKAYRFPEYDTPAPIGKNVAVIGGGNVAMDAARCALRLGSENVHIVYRRSRTEMPARAEEIHHGEEEGIQFHLLQNPLRIIGDEKGWVKALEIQKMELGEPDATGRRRPVPVIGSEFMMDVDAVVISIGTSANPLLKQTTPGMNFNKWGYIEVNEQTAATTVPGVYAGGDIVTGSATVILAMGAGRQAAKAMHEYMMQ
jgi:glutamate synthase (NADPH/NADH) small chain